MNISFSDVELAARAVLSVAPSISDSNKLQQRVEEALEAESRGYFAAGEDDLLKQFFAEYLQARAALFETLAELRPILDSRKLKEEQHRQVFAVAYAAATMLVRAARFLVDLGIEHPTIREKLNEADPTYGLERKQYTKIYRSLTSPDNVFRLYQAREFYRSHREELFSACAKSETLQSVAAILRDTEEAMDFDVARYLRARIRYRLYSTFRRALSSYKKATFALLEVGGRVVAELKNPLISKQVSKHVTGNLLSLLQPGDILVTRHKQALSNVFLPGFWPHVALYIGTEAQRKAMEIECPPVVSDFLQPQHNILEAKKDGVLFRNIDETLQVDYVAVIRPLITPGDLRTALSRGMGHAGKLYDFGFDFTVAERLVCTEVVYRSYDGIGEIDLPLIERAGRMTLSAEDLLNLALDRTFFKPIAVFGLPGAEQMLVTGDASGALIRTSMNMHT